MTSATRPMGLPQLHDRLFLTDSGLETTLIFRDHLDLPAFAAFVLLESSVGRRRQGANGATNRRHSGIQMYQALTTRPKAPR